MKLCDSRAALLFQGCLSQSKHRWGWGAVWDLGTWKRHRHREELRKVRHCEVLVLAGLLGVLFRACIPILFWEAFPAWIPYTQKHRFVCSLLSGLQKLADVHV